jgi:hypothetical protein
MKPRRDFSIFQCLFLALGMWMPHVFGQSQENPLDAHILEVEVHGEGLNDEEALQAAFVKALQQTLGALIQSHSTAENFVLSQDIIHLLTNGSIESYEELERESGLGTVIIKIRARVRRGMIADYLRESKVDRKVDLRDEWARLATSARSKKQALDLFRSSLPRIKARLYSVTLIDLGTGEEIGASGNPTPKFQSISNNETLAVWAAVIKPDLEFWDAQAAPLLEACLDVLGSHKGTLTVRMDSGGPEANFFEKAPHGFEGNFQRSPVRRWQRIRSGRLPWEGTSPVPSYAAAPRRIAIQRNSQNAETLELSVHALGEDVYQQLLAPLNPSEQDPSKKHTLRNMWLYVRARLSFTNGQSTTLLVGQTAPLFLSMGIPWTGATDAEYCGPLFPVGWMRGGWSMNSAWPDWDGVVFPITKTPGFDSFLLWNGRIMRTDGGYQDAHEKWIRVQRGRNHKEAPARCEFDSEILVPIVFKLPISSLNKLSKISLEIPSEATR